MKWKNESRIDVVIKYQARSRIGNGLVVMVVMVVVVRS